MALLTFERGAGPSPRPPRRGLSQSSLELSASDQPRGPGGLNRDPDWASRWTPHPPHPPSCWLEPSSPCRRGRTWHRARGAFVVAAAVSRGASHALQLQRPRVPTHEVKQTSNKRPPGNPCCLKSFDTTM